MIEIFEQERLDGIAELMIGESLAFELDIKADSQFDFNKFSAMLSAKADFETINDDTLFPIESILASVGMNLNDDVFLEEEILKARNTPIDKPFNKMHNDDDIIGHMTASRLLDENFNEVGPDSKFTHIAVSSVIYKIRRDENKEKEIAKIIDEIKNGKWKVSMECVFPHFDYAIISPDGKQSIIPRTPATAYLTKYLRKYNGPGYYNNNKIGRVFRNINFCGKGLVERPGNPFSFITTNNMKFTGAIASIDELKETVMTEQEKAQLEEAIGKALKAEAELAKYKEEAAEAAAKKLNEAVAQKEVLIEEQKGVIAGLQSDLAKVNTSLAGLNEVLETAKAELTDKTEKLNTAEASLKTIEAEKIVIARKSALSNAGVTPEKADLLLTKFASANQEVFETLVNTLSEFKTSSTATAEVVTTTTTTETTEANFAEASLETTAELNVATAASEKAVADSKAISNYLFKNVLTAGKAKTKGDK